MARTSQARRALVLIAVGVFVLLGTLALLARFVCVVRRVSVEVDAQADLDDVVRRAKLGFGLPILNVSEDAVRKNLSRSGLYELEKLSIRLPDTVMMTVHVRSEDVLTFYSGSYLVLSADGTVVRTATSLESFDGVYVQGLGLTSARPGQVVNAPQARLTAMASAVEAIQTYDAVGLVRALDVESPSNVRIYTENDVEVLLGDDSQMPDKVRLMASIVGDMRRNGMIGGTLDVRSGVQGDYRPD